MNYIDFFSGSGGLSIGLESEGLELVYANDLNKHATDTFKRNLTFIGSDKKKVINLPIELLHKQLIKQKIKKDYQGKVHMNNRTKKIYDSYKNYSAEDVNFDKYKKENLGNIDMIVGGPPCQGFSTAARGGKSKIKITKTDFIDDPRNQLFKFFLDFVDYYNPKIVLIENVPGLTTAPNYLKIIESTLSKCANGYFTSSHILDSSYFGVPQKRERVFIIGIRKDINENTYLLKAKTGSTDKENPNLIKLYDVRAIIDFNKKNEIMVTSREAIYNNITYDTKFIGNVLIEFESQTITCDNMNAKLSENIAIISGNIIYKNEFSQFYADKIEFDLLDKSSKITMFDKNEKIKINYKKDGFN